MTVGAITQTVEVVARPPRSRPTPANVGSVQRVGVVELPLNGRNYADWLLSTNAVKSPIAVSFSASGTPREGAFTSTACAARITTSC